MLLILVFVERTVFASLLFREVLDARFIERDRACIAERRDSN